MTTVRDLTAEVLSPLFLKDGSEHFIISRRKNCSCPAETIKPFRRLSQNEIFFPRLRKAKNYNYRNTLKYFEGDNLSLTQRLGKIAILVQSPRVARA